MPLLRAMIIANEHEEEIFLILTKEETNYARWEKDLKKIIAENKRSGWLVLNPVVKKNINKLEPLDNIIQVIFAIWNPDRPVLN